MHFFFQVSAYFWLVGYQRSNHTTAVILLMDVIIPLMSAIKSLNVTIVIWVKYSMSIKVLTEVNYVMKYIL